MRNENKISENELNSNEIVKEDEIEKNRYHGNLEELLNDVEDIGKKMKEIKGDEDE